LLLNHKYSRIVCFNLDRNVLDLINLSNDIKLDCEEKLNFISSKSFDDDILSHSLSSLKSLKSNLKKDTTFAIIINSLSELIIHYGVVNTLDYVERLHSLILDLENNSNPALVVTLHDSYHSDDIISQIQEKFSVNVKIVPNSGILSSEVVAEIQTIRKSNETGKMSENIEMFSFKDSSLNYLTNSNKNESLDRDLYGNINGNKEDNNDVNTFKKLKDLKIDNFTRAEIPVDATSTISSITKNSSLSAVYSKTQSAIANNSSSINSSNNRLITFDSTDPEFDEDSDPDADLDL
jgi:hypothetical protein